MNSVQSQELVVLLDDGGRSIGTAPKSEVHHRSTPLHLAFSCYLFDDAGRVLLTRRALGQAHFSRRLDQFVLRTPRTRRVGGWRGGAQGAPGVGCRSDGLDLRAAATFATTRSTAEGILENEFCPVFCARVVGSVDADPTEIMDFAWVQWDQLRAAAQFRGRSARGR